MDPDEPAFGAADVASIIGEKERRVRDLHDRGFGGFFGRREGWRVTYTTREVAGAAVARDLVALGFAPQIAARVGAALMRKTPRPHDVLEGSPARIAMIAPEPGDGIKHDRCRWRAPSATTSAISIPVGRIWTDVVAKATRISRERTT